MTDTYILEGITPVPCTDLLAWVAWFETTNRVVQQTTVKDNIEVSTVFLGLDHSFSRNGPPVLFETMVFGGPLGEEQDRYATWGDAVLGHAAMVARVRQACEMET